MAGLQLKAGCWLALAVGALIPAYDWQRAGARWPASFQQLARPFTWESASDECLKQFLFLFLKLFINLLKKFR